VLSIDAVVLRYLAAFGPATPADASTWSRLTGMREVFDRLRPRLRVWRDERGRELFDVPDAAMPGADVPAPVRFLPEYDNLLLSHADRTRFSTDENQRHLAAAAGPAKGTLLVDGVVAGIWQAGGGAAVVEHVPLPRDAVDDVEAEAQAMAAFWLRTAEPDVRLVPVRG
jgi:hypothetical protein